MTFSRPKAAVFGALFAATLGSGRLAHSAGRTANAGSAPPPASATKASRPLAQVLQGEAKAAYDGARVLYNDSDWSGAFSKFKRAYDLSNEPRLLWNMAACEKAQRHYARAYTLVGRYLKDASEIITAENRANAEETRKALRGFYSLVALSDAPSGARVVVDGEDVGKAPLQELALDVGVHTIRIELDGFEPFEARVDVPGTTDTSVTVRMTRRATTARLTVAAAADATLRIDTKLVGVGRWEGALPAGEHSINVTAKGKKMYQSTLELRAGSIRTVEVTLEDEAKAGGPVWPWVVGGVVLAGGAAVGGYFLLKPKDEQGSSPNGALGAVVVPAHTAVRLP